MQWRTAVRTRWALLTWALVTAAACSPSSADRAGPSATVAQEAPTSTLPADPYAVPPVIDEAYVNRVLAGLDAALGDVTRLVIRTRTFPREAYDRLRSVYIDRTFLQLAIDGYQRDIRQNFAGYRNIPGNRATVVTRIISARSNCIFAQVTRSYDAVGLNTLRELDTQWVGLGRIDPSTEERYTNITSWGFIYDGFPSDRSQPPDPCGA